MVFSLDKNVEKSNVEDDPETYDKIKNADCNSKGLTFDCAKS